jgi:hypothetical protein
MIPLRQISTSLLVGSASRRGRRKTRSFAKRRTTLDTQTKIM